MEGKLFVISAPSGCGKTTIARAILQRHPEILFSVSATTRPKRNGEIHGRDYFFLTREEFEEYIRQGNLIEWEEIYGNYYGTLKREVEKALRDHSSMLFDIDVKGALSIRKHFPKESVLIFIAPPSLDVLRERLIKRQTENEEAIKKRLERASMELGLQKEFDYVVVNDDLQEAIDRVEKIILGESLKNKV